MKKTVTFIMFCDSFSDTYRGNFTYEGKRALFEYLNELEESTGTEIELDPVSFCCEYTEYENLADLQGDYPSIQSMEELENITTVVPVFGERFIIEVF